MNEMQVDSASRRHHHHHHHHHRGSSHEASEKSHHHHHHHSQTRHPSNDSDDNDFKAKRRSHRHSAESSKPGAHYERNPRHSKNDKKHHVTHSSATSGHGAVGASHRSSHQALVKKINEGPRAKRHSEHVTRSSTRASHRAKSGSVPGPRPATGSSDEMESGVLQAEIAAPDVSMEDHEKALKENDELRQQLHQMQHEQQVSVDESNTGQGSKRWRVRLALLCCFLILAGVAGAVVAALMMKNSSPDLILDSPPKTVSNTTKDITSGPTTVSISPTLGPTLSPTETMIYNAPTEEECLAISSGLALGDQVELIERNFELDMDVSLETPTEMTEELELELAEKIRQYLVPSLAGCPDDDVDVLGNNERLLANTDYVIAGGTVTVASIPDLECEDNAEVPCFRTVGSLDLLLKGELSTFELIALMTKTFTSVPLVTRLRLDRPFTVVVIVGVRSTNPTDVPSAAPSLLPSETPSWVPSAQPSLGPISTIKPSIEPGLENSISPTAAPTPNPTPGPTPRPSLSPTVSPTTSSPSVIPTTIPTPDPTVAPVAYLPPTDAPVAYLPPTDAPVAVPLDLSMEPSTEPSTTPSMKPSLLPSMKPTTNPSSSPSVAPSIATPSPLASNACLVDDSNGFRSLLLSQNCIKRVRSAANYIRPCTELTGDIAFDANGVTVWGAPENRFRNIGYAADVNAGRVIEFDFNDSVTYVKWRAVTSATSCSYNFSGMRIFLKKLPSFDVECEDPMETLAVTYPATTHNSWDNSMVLNFNEWVYTTFTISASGEYRVTTCLGYYDCASPSGERVGAAQNYIGTPYFIIFDTYCSEQTGMQIAEFKTNAAYVSPP